MVVYTLRLLEPFVIRQSVQRHVNGYRSATFKHASAVVFPFPRRKNYASAGACTYHRRHHISRAEHPLVGYLGITTIGIGVFETLNDGFARCSRLACTLQYVVAKGGMEVGHGLYGLQMLSIEDTPRCYRELHHGHKGVNLRRTNDELLVELTGIDT